MASSVSAPANLRELVHAAFVRARAAGDLLFFPTQVALVRVDGFPFQLRYAPSLANKPSAPKQPPKTDGAAPAAPPPPADPFADPPPGLVVLPRLGAAATTHHHRLLLNKFAICPDHAILATAAFRPQHHLLDAADLAAAYACIEAYGQDDDNSGLFVFYNSGPHSGASQPHRHLQMLPVARMREGLAAEDAAAWGVLVDGVGVGEASSSPLPFTVAAARLPPAPVTPEALHALYLRLYREARAAVAAAAAAATKNGGASRDGSEDTKTEADDFDEAEEQGRVPARISYNLALTRRTMAVCPRTAEGAEAVVRPAADGTSRADAEAGGLSLNGTVLAGTALVKSAAAWEALRQDAGQLARVLRAIGVPPRRGTASL